MTRLRIVGRVPLLFGWPVVMLCLVPLLAHLPELLGWVDTYPLLVYSQLVLHPHSGILPGTPFIDGNACQTTLSLGHLAAEDWLHGILPWWNPYTGVGLPLASEMQPAAFFLPFILLLHFHSGVLLIKLAMQMLAGLACFGFLRQVGVARGPAVLGSVLFQCNGTFAWYADAPMLPIAFLPLLLLGLERARTDASADRRGGEAMIALAIAFSLLAGHPEVALLDGLLGLAWAAFRIRGLSRRCGVAFIWKMAAGGLAGLALAAPVLIPFLQDLRVSTLGFPRVPGGHALQPQHLAALLFPNIYGPPHANWDFWFWTEAGGYIGAATAFLAVLSLFQRRASPHLLGGARWLLALWVFVWLAASFGAPWVTEALRLVPGLNEVWICRYCMPSVEFAFCVLAAFALDDDARSPGRLPVWWPLALLGAAAGLALLLGYHEISFTGRGGWFAAISVLWGIGAVLSLALVLRLPDFPVRRYLIAGIVCADAIGLFLPTTLTGATNSDMFDAPIAYLRANQHLQRAVSVDQALPPNVGALLGFGSLQYMYLPVPAIWATFVQQRLDPSAWTTSFPGLLEPPQSVVSAISEHRATLEALAVRYVVAPSSIDLFSVRAGPFRLFGPQTGKLRPAPVFRPMRPFHLPFRPQTGKQQPVPVFSPLSPPVRVFREGGIDIFELPAAAPYAETIGGPCQLTVIDREHMHATCDAPARLIRRELMFPGWTARVNGQPAAVGNKLETFTVRDGEIFQAVSLPAGVSDTVWRYVPLHASAIAMIFIAGMLALIAFVVRSAAERKSPAA
jgi:hypothetical protein